MRRHVLLPAALIALLGTPAAASADAHFKSPSGNLHCRVTADPLIADCMAQTNEWAQLKPRPASCDVDWFPAEIALIRRKLSIGSCRGDIGPMCVGTSGPDSCTVLRYGRSVQVGTIRCTSKRRGVICRRTNGRRQGFRISRQGYRLFR